MNQKDYDTIAKETDATILSFYFGHGNIDISKKIHFVAITKENGKYYVHNNGDNSYKIAYNSITDILNKITLNHSNNLDSKINFMKVLSWV